MNILGNRIKKERNKLGLSREELANKLGVSYSAISMYERGEREPNNELTAKMCKIFNCSMDYLIGITEFENPKNDIEKKLFNLNLSEKEFDTVINLLTNKDKINFLFDFIKNKDPNIKKIVDAYKICLSVCWDYSLEALNDINNYEHIKSIYDSPMMEKALNIVNSLDKQKIIHNYVSGEQIDDILNEAMIGMSKEDYKKLTDTQKKQIRDFAIYIKNQSGGDTK